MSEQRSLNEETSPTDCRIIACQPSWDMNLSILERRIPWAYAIYCACRDIYNSFLNYESNKSTLVDLISVISIHACNLYDIFEDDVKNIISTVKTYVEKFMEIFISPLQINQDSLENGDSARDTDEQLNKPYYERILDVVEERLALMCSPENTFEEVLALFGELLSSTCEQVLSKIRKDYDEMLSYNHGAIGEEKTKVILSNIGINSCKDFGNNKFLQIIDEIKLNSVHSWNLSTPTKILKELLKELSVFRNYILACSEVLNSDAEKTVIFLIKSVSLFIKPLIEKFIFVKTFYQGCVSHFDSKTAMEMLLRAFDLDSSSYAHREPSDSLFFDIAFGITDILKLASTVAEMHKNNELDTYEGQKFSNDFVISNLLSLCTCFYEKVYPNKKAFKRESEKQFKKASYFIMGKFTETFKSLDQSNSDFKNISSKLEGNIQFFCKKDFTRLCQTFSEINKREIFDQVMKKFANEKFTEELIEEYHNEMDRYDDVNVEIGKEPIANDGMKIHLVDVNRDAHTREYIDIAADLFGLSLCSISLVSKTENLIVLRTINKFIMFHFKDNEDIAFVMQVDLSVGI